MVAIDCVFPTLPFDVTWSAADIHARRDSLTSNLQTGKLLRFNNVAHAPVCSQPVMKAANSIRAEDPFSPIGQQFAIQPARGAETEHSFVGESGGARKRPAIIVVPAQEVLLRRPFRIDWMEDDGIGGIYDLLSGPD